MKRRKLLLNHFAQRAAASAVSEPRSCESGASQAAAVAGLAAVLAALSWFFGWQAVLGSALTTAMFTGVINRPNIEHQIGRQHDHALEKESRDRVRQVVDALRDVFHEFRCRPPHLPTTVADRRGGIGATPARNSSDGSTIAATGCPSFASISCCACA